MALDQVKARTSRLMASSVSLAAGGVVIMLELVGRAGGMALRFAAFRKPVDGECTGLPKPAYAAQVHVAPSPTHHPPRL